MEEFLVLAEHPLAARRAALTAARPAAGACSRRFRVAAEVLPASFGNRASAAANQPLNAAAALRASVERSLRHFLAPLKAASARIAEIIVGWHRQVPFNNPVFIPIIRS
jgi:hypothetical protein